MKRAAILLMILVLASLGAAWLAAKPKASATDGTQPMLVVATFYPLADFAAHVGKTHVVTRALVPPGSEPHDYEPTPQDIVAASKAKVFLMNGGVDAWAEKILPDLRARGVLLVRVADTMPDITRDPHVWLDPVLAAKIVGEIRDALMQADPPHADEYAANAEDYLASLKRLDADYRSGLAQCASHTIVASHDALGYMAHEYGLEVVPIAGLSPDEEPSPARMAEVAEKAKAAHATYIFFEELVSPKLAQTIAAEVGAQTLVFNPIEGLTSKDLAEGRDYLSVMRDNLANLRTALACR